MGCCFPTPTGTCINIAPASMWLCPRRTGSTWLCLLTCGARANGQPSTEGLRQPAAGSKSCDHPLGRGRLDPAGGPPLHPVPQNARGTLSLKQPEPPPEDTHRSTSRGSGRHFKRAPPQDTPKSPPCSSEGDTATKDSGLFQRKASLLGRGFSGPLEETKDGGGFPSGSSPSGPHPALSWLLLQKGQDSALHGRLLIPTQGRTDLRAAGAGSRNRHKSDPATKRLSCLFSLPGELCCFPCLGLS